MKTIKLCLEELKAGSEVVAVVPAKDGGKPTIYPHIYVVTEWDERFKRWRYTRQGSLKKHAGAFPADGGRFNFMSKSKEPDYYMSANVAHIKAAKASAKRVAANTAKKEAVDMAVFEEFKRKLEALLTEYSAEIYAEQTNGDDQGVEVAAFISARNCCSEIGR